MRSFEIWSTLSKELNHGILQAAYLQEKRLYRHTVQDLSQALRKRPQAILEIPREARHELFRPLLGLPQFDVLGHNLLIHWLGTDCRDMLCDFLDGVGVAHDGKGCAEEFPGAVDASRLSAACGRLYEKYPADRVTLYLRLFPNITGVAWQGMEAQVRN